MIYNYLAHFNPNRYPDGRFAPKGTGSTLSFRDRRDAAKLIKSKYNIRDTERTGLTELVASQKKVKAAEQQLADSEKSFYDFEDIGYDRMRTYKLLAMKAKGNVHYNPDSDLDMLEIMHGHWDTGTNSSFDLWLRDNGSSWDTFHKAHSAASDAYRAACREATDSLLGLYGRAKVFNKRTTVSERLAEDTAWDRILRHQPDDPSKLEEAKRRGYTVRF